MWQGIYFTLDAEYAVNEYSIGYYEMKLNDGIPLLVCAIVPGHFFPVVEVPPTELTSESGRITLTPPAF